MKRILYGLIIGFCLIPNINALECNSSDKERLQKLANNISYAIEEYEENGEIYFKATLTGVSKELTIYNGTKLKYYWNTSADYIGEVNIDSIKTNSKIKLELYGNYTCLYDTVREITIVTPGYNRYYGDSICDNASEYKLCQKWYQNDLSYDEFINDVNNYISNKKDNNGNNTGSSYDDYYFDFNFGRFYRLVYFPSLAVTVILIILLIVFWNKENKKNRL